MLLILSIILSFFVTSSINAQTLDYNNIYMEYLTSYNINEYNPEKVLFYDLNNDGTPEMIFNQIKNSGNICDIYTIKNNKIEKIYNINEKLKSDNITFFTTNNDKNLYYVIKNSNLKYYKLNYDGSKITSNLIAELETKFFEDLKLKKLNLNSDKYYYNDKQVSEIEFLNKLNFKKALIFTSLKDIINVEKMLSNYNNPPANINYEHKIEQYYNKNSEIKNIKYIIYNNGLYEIYENTPYILMINGNIIPKANVIIENKNLYLPIRAIYNYLNKDINYNAKNNTITVNNITINLKNGTTSENKKVIIKNVNGITYLPIEFFNNFNIYYLDTNSEKFINLEEKSLKINYSPIKPLIDEIKNLEFKDIVHLKVGSVSEPVILGRYYFFKVHLNYISSYDEHLSQFDEEKYFIYDNYSNIKYFN